MVFPLSLKDESCRLFLTDLPAEVSAANVQWPGPKAPDPEQVAPNLLRVHGLDPRLFPHEKGDYHSAGHDGGYGTVLQ